MTKRRTWVINGVLVLALGGAAFGAYQAFAPAEGDAQAQSRTTPVTRADVTESVSAAGTVASAYTANADFGTAGEVATIEVAVGDTVTAGQRLATLDSAQAERKLDLARSELAAAEEELANAPETSAALQAKVDQAEIEVADAETAVANTVLTAPGAGTVTTINGYVGQQVGNGGSGFVVLTDLRNYLVDSSIAEVDTAKVKAGQQATVTVNALSGKEITATVESIALTPAESGDTVTYPAKLKLSEPPEGLRPGQSTSVSITVAEAKNALAVPAAAVPGGGTVLVRRDGQDVPVRVELGVRGQALVEVKSGLSEGDQVVLQAAGARQ
ncbi:efflux RND transporter periplasmic adaptor subunit [Amycolatopsis sp. YIM 10]|uniref:efflux RND transporter periplasmic adaptor subunit n=1 Tax=Amycolatopsis sp. YIM 10 TaxID=2653857 RepID=UPI00128FD964|nr:efflux RND transporter periplasmic adaptor subunit [Amycolatopsis sp. YIM 10]QFU94184.1 Macrolide export protein MacA [Amycolatopsis sp. YIM 10]